MTRLMQYVRGFPNEVDVVISALRNNAWLISQQVAGGSVGVTFPPRSPFADTEVVNYVRDKDKKMLARKLWRYGVWPLTKKAIQHAKERNAQAQKKQDELQK